MYLQERFSAMTVDDLSNYMGLCGGGKGITRKADRIDFLVRTLGSRQEIARLWQTLDDLSRKAVGTAYHNDGHFNADAFVAQYGSLPERPKHKWGSWYRELIPMDLFIHGEIIPPEIMPHLADLVSLPERFQLTGSQEIPAQKVVHKRPVPQKVVLRQEAGRHDLLLFLSLLSQGVLKLSKSNGRLTPKTAQILWDQLQDGDFTNDRVGEGITLGIHKVDESICLFGLNLFALQGGLITQDGKLTESGQVYLATENPALLLDALDAWTQADDLDELTRIRALKGLRAKGIELTSPGMRRAQVVEALSWCPVGEWISISDFYRAMKIWHFDFEVEEDGLDKIYVGYRYGRDGWYEDWAEGDSPWLVTTGLNINVILWETLASIGALDIIYAPDAQGLLPAQVYNYDDSTFSDYDGLLHFRINPLGAYLFGQADDFAPARPLDAALFEIDNDGIVRVVDPAGLSPVHHAQMEPMADSQPDAKGAITRYRLSKQKLLTILESEADLALQRGFLAQRNRGPLPAAVQAFFDQTETDSTAVQEKSRMFTVQVRTPELAQAILDDPVAGKLTRSLDSRTLLIAESKKSAFRKALREMGYGMAG